MYPSKLNVALSFKAAKAYMEADSSAPILGN